MAWNEPGDNQNPWNKRPSQTPPDLDEIIRNMQRKLSGLLGGRGGGGGAGRIGLGFIALLVAIGWGLTGFYKVDEAERGVVLRFGKYLSTSMPGLHWRIPWPVDSVEKVNIERAETYPHKTRMLTADENIVDVDLAVQFRRPEPKDYLFNVRDPDSTLREVTESAIREVVGHTQMDFLLREGRAEVAQQTQKLLQSTLDYYGTGIEIIRVNLQDANFPTQVQAAVQDAIKAREDKERLVLEAQSYANDILPRARGAAARQIQDSQAYRARVIADAEGEAGRFSRLLVEYEKAPEVTRERLHLETVERVFADSSKILVEGDGTGNLIYLPIDKLIEQRARQAARERDSSLSGAHASITDGDGRTDDPRTRGSR